MNDPNHNDSNGTCGNCQNSIGDSNYCSACGQKQADRRVSIGELFSVVFSTIFNLESKFFQTIRDVFIPGQLTNEWFKGKRKPYFHPVRLFIVTAILLTAVVGPYLSKNNTLYMTGHHDRAKQEKYRKSFIQEIENYNVLHHVNADDKSTLDSLINTMQKSYITSGKRTMLNYQKTHNLHELDGKSLVEKITYFHEELGSEMTDSMLRADRPMARDSVNLSNFNMFIDGKDSKRKISNEDFLKLTPTQIADKYGVKGFYDRLHFRQKTRALQGNKNLLPFILANSLWVILLMMPFLALILKLLYARLDYYYIEHLIFSFHCHSFAFILFAIFGIIMQLVYFHTLMIPVGLTLLFIYLYLSLRSVYKQSKGMTLAKLLVANLVYLILLLFFITFGFIVSIFLF